MCQKMLDTLNDYVQCVNCYAHIHKDTSRTILVVAQLGMPFNKKMFVRVCHACLHAHQSLDEVE